MGWGRCMCEDYSASSADPLELWRPGILTAGSQQSLLLPFAFSWTSCAADFTAGLLVFCALCTTYVLLLWKSLFALGPGPSCMLSQSLLLMLRDLIFN